MVQLRMRVIKLAHAIAATLTSKPDSDFGANHQPYPIPS